MLDIYFHALPKSTKSTVPVTGDDRKHNHWVLSEGVTDRSVDGSVEFHMDGTAYATTRQLMTILDIERWGSGGGGRSGSGGTANASKSAARAPNTSPRSKL